MADFEKAFYTIPEAAELLRLASRCGVDSVLVQDWGALTLAQEVARRGITVNAVAPGFIRTDMVEGLDETELKKTIPANRFGEAEEVAELVGFLVSDKAAYITGECISITGGLY